MKYHLNIVLLERYMRGETSPEEELQLLTWFRESAAEEDIIAFYRQRWLDSSKTKLPQEIQERMFRQIKATMKLDNQQVILTDKSWQVHFRRWLQYAAAIIFFIGIGITSHLYTRQSLVIENKYLVEAEKGQRASITLPDGTKVWLNSHTQVSYSSDYGHKERIVNLTGEAYFEVAKDKEHRFVVKTKGLDVEALGTSFNVKAYREDNYITATLFAGSIRATADNKSVILAPDQQVLFDRETSRLKVEKPDNASYAYMWRDNELAFKGETLNDIAIRLNRIYNVQVVFSSEKIRQYRFSGIIKNNSLDNVIEIISLTAPIMYESRGDTIILSERQ